MLQNGRVVVVVCCWKTDAMTSVNIKNNTDYFAHTGGYACRCCCYSCCCCSLSTCSFVFLVLRHGQSKASNKYNNDHHHHHPVKQQQKLSQQQQQLNYNSNNNKHTGAYKINGVVIVVDCCYSIGFFQ